MQAFAAVSEAPATRRRATPTATWCSRTWRWTCATAPPPYGWHVMVELSAENGVRILIPKGSAHGALTLAPDTELAYKVDGFCAPDYDLDVRRGGSDLAVP